MVTLSAGHGTGLEGSRVAVDLSANCRRLFASKSTAAGDRRHEGAGGAQPHPRARTGASSPAAGHIDSITKIEIIRHVFLITKHEVPITRKFAVDAHSLQTLQGLHSLRVRPDVHFSICR